MAQIAYKLVTRTYFESDDVRERLERVYTAEALDSTYERERALLEGVVPATLPLSAIDLRLGAAWIDPVLIQEFAQEVLEISCKVTFVPEIAHWEVDVYAGQDSLPNSSSYAIKYKTFKKKKKGGGWIEKEEEINGNDLLEIALNLKIPQIKVRKEPGAVPELDLNLTAHLNGKLEDLQDRFAQWCRSDSKRATNLEETYNRRFNSRRYREWDGSHLTFPGMSQKWRDRIQARPYQLRAIAMAISIGGGLFLEVGLGKTACAVAAAFERKRIGNCSRPWIVVQKSTLRQFARTAQEMYPGARILVAGKNDLAARNRQLFLAKARAGDWDFVILTHEQFGSIPLSEKTTRAYYDHQITVMEQAIYGQDPDYSPDMNPKEKSKSIKALEKAVRGLRKRAERIAEQKDAGITLEQLSPDLLIVDEADRFRRRFFRTKMSGIVGLNSTSGSDRAMDFDMKRQWIQQNHGTGRVVLMTGTPIVNTLAELYTVLMYLAPDIMEEYGWAEFDSWAAHCGAILSQPEVKHTGTIKIVQRFAKYLNLPELLRVFRSVSQTTRADDEGVVLERPDPIHIAVTAQMSDYQKEFANGLVERAERCEKGFPLKWSKLYWYDTRQFDEVIQNHPDPNIQDFMRTDHKGIVSDMMANQLYLQILGGKGKHSIKEVDPVDFVAKYGQEEADKYLRYGPVSVFVEDEDEDGEPYSYWGPHVTTDNMLSISTLGRKLALDQRMVDWRIEAEPTNRDVWAERDNPHSKFHKCMRRVQYIYNRFRHHKATQVIFCDLGTPKGNKFSLYQAFKEDLIRRGIPGDEIAFIQDYNTDEKKEALFEAMNKGDIAVLIGHTETMGVGVNIQERLIAMHHYDCPWQPRGLEQRNGRGIRPGNMFKRILVYSYLTQGYNGNTGFDAFMWQCVQAKWQFIIQVLTGRLDVRVIEEDVSESPVFSAAEMKALATGNEKIIDYVTVTNELRKITGRIQGTNNEIAGLESGSGIKSIQGLTDTITRRTNRYKAMSKDIPDLMQHIEGCTGDNFNIRIGEDEFTTKTASGRAIWKFVEAATQPDVADTYCNKYVKLGEYGGIPLQIFIQRITESTTDKDGQLVTTTSITPQVYFANDWGKNYYFKALADHHALGQRLEETYLKIFSEHTQLATQIEDNKAELAKFEAQLQVCRNQLKDLRYQRKELLDQKESLEKELGITPDEQAGQEKTVVVFGGDETEEAA